MTSTVLIFGFLINAVLGNGLHGRALIGLCTPRTETFDTLSGNLLGGLVPVLNPVNDGTYRELNYDTASLVKTGNAVIKPVTPNTGSNIAVFGIAASLIDGIGGGSVSTTPKITIKSAGKTKSFDFNSFYIACGLNTETTLAGVPIACTATATGVDVNGRDKSMETLSFAPDKQPGATMQFKAFQGWTQMVNVTIQIGTTSAAAGTVFFFDTVKYCAYT